MTTFNSIDNIYRIAFGNTIFNIEMAKDSLHYLSKEQVQQILTHVNHVTREHYALLHPSDATLIKPLKYGLIVGTRLTSQDVYLYRLVFGVCPCCLAGKTKNSSFSESKTPSFLMPGHTVNVDLIPFNEKCVCWKYSGSLTLLR